MHCDIGRGMVDIFGCICACMIVILISKIIECKTSYIGAVLAYFGRYSLLILCVHIVELDLLPWWQIIEKYVVNGMSANIQLILIIVGKLILDLGDAFVLSKITFVRRIFGFKTKCKLLSNDRLEHFLEFVLLVNIAILLYLCFNILCMFVNTK